MSVIYDKIKSLAHNFCNCNIRTLGITGKLTSLLEAILIRRNLIFSELSTEMPTLKHTNL